MFWPFRRLRRPPKVWFAPKLKFIGEQDGAPERQLKTDIVAILSEKLEVQRAYLARVRFNDSQNEEVVLAIASTSGEDHKLVESLGKAFAHIFHRDVHLDIMFLSPEQESDAAEVCRPFYSLG